MIVLAEVELRVVDFPQVLAGMVKRVVERAVIVFFYIQSVLVKVVKEVDVVILIFGSAVDGVGNRCVRREIVVAYFLYFLRVQRPS